MRQPGSSNDWVDAAEDNCDMRKLSLRGPLISLASKFVHSAQRQGL